MVWVGVYIYLYIYSITEVCDTGLNGGRGGHAEREREKERNAGSWFVSVSATQRVYSTGLLIYAHTQHSIVMKVRFIWTNRVCVWSSRQQEAHWCLCLNKTFMCYQKQINSAHHNKMLEGKKKKVRMVWMCLCYWLSVPKLVFQSGYTW